LAFATQAAHAKLILVFDDPSTGNQDLVIEDNSQLDLDPLEGAIEYCQPAGSVNMLCGEAFSKPSVGSATSPVLEFSFGPIRWGGELNIRITDTDFSNGPASADVAINGQFEGFDGVTFNFWGDSSNQSFGMGQLIYETSINSDGDFLRGATVDADAIGSLTFEANLESSETENAIGFSGLILLQSSQGTVEVPDVVGDQQSTAEQKITDAGLVVGNITTQASESASVGEVISQSPDAGADASPGTRVNLVVSAGSAPEEVGDTAGLAGLWYDPAFDGEGFNVLVGPDDSLLLYYYGWRSNGQRLWLLSETKTDSIFFGQSITLGMFITKSGTFADPDPELQDWGEMTIIFDSCTAARAHLQGDDGTKTVNLVKLLGIDDLDCGP
jgi:hypothetical protein